MPPKKAAGGNTKKADAYEEEGRVDGRFRRETQIFDRERGVPRADVPGFPPNATKHNSEPKELHCRLKGLYENPSQWTKSKLNSVRPMHPVPVSLPGLQTYKRTE
ncbi:hypothetical protein AOLI_G00004580 [Acnodon oligacanthus]